MAAASLHDAVRPVTGGLMISPTYGTAGYCSVGLQAFKNDSSGYPDPSLGRFIATASHCTPPIGSVTSLTFGQPNLSFGHHATEVADAPLLPLAACPSGAISCQWADVAILKMVDSVSSTYQRVALSNTSSPPTYLGQLSISSIVSGGAVVGLPVRRVGATTGQHDGVVMNGCYDVNLSFHYILCSVEVKGDSSSYGDSGSPVYVAANPSYPYSPWPAGILFAGVPAFRTWWFSTVSLMGTALGGAYSF